MFSNVDERCGLVKVCWSDVRDRVADVEPMFRDIVDNIDPDIRYPLYLAYLPYGSLKGDVASTFLPTCQGGYIRLTDPAVPKEVHHDLGYGQTSSPLGMVLEKEVEYFVDLNNEKMIIPWAIYSPGSFFSFARNLDGSSTRVYAPNGVLTASAGARSAFMLPNIGCATNHINLQRDFDVSYPSPKSLYEHWYVFKEIINSSVANCDWMACLLYFSEAWVNKIQSDDAWLKLKVYLHEKSWRASQYHRCRLYYDMAFSIIQKKRNLKPSPYLVDTARHLFAIALGDAPGFAPSQGEDGLPAGLLRQAYLESYGLKKYIPTIMTPVKYSYETDQSPVYYSLQNPSTFMFSPKSRSNPSTTLEMRELHHIMNVFMDELSHDHAMCSDTVMNMRENKLVFNCYHNKADRDRVIKSSNLIPVADNRFMYDDLINEPHDKVFASDSPFVRGCISISSNNSEA